MRSFVHMLVVILSLAALAASALWTDGPAAAAKKSHDDKKLGFRIKIDADWVQIPPKLDPATAFLAGEWYEDSAQFGGGFRPSFHLCWWAQPKGAATTGGPAPAAPAAGNRDGSGAPKIESIDEYASRFLQGNVRAFGKPVPIEDRWKEAESVNLGGKPPVVLDYFELNPPGKKLAKGEAAPAAYAVVGRIRLDRPTETVEVGFLAFCAWENSKKLSKEFISIMRSFQDLRTGTDTLNLGAEAELSDDPAKRREQVRNTKVIPGWACVDTENYILLYSKEVDPVLVRKIGSQIESIRAQIYETMFPSDRPITAVCIVRVCKDREQYIQYGGSPNSAGYWSSDAEELVFFEDQTKQEDSLRVLYHEAFHQYIHYSVGDFAPHSWFNEGHGDFFAGHNLIGGKWVCGQFDWRVAAAKAGKAMAEFPPLKEWLGWTQLQYYGRNEARISPQVNYAMGWSFIYFLRRSKNPEYKQILPKYFDTLKSRVTAARAIRDEWDKQVKAWEERKKAEPEAAGPKPELPKAGLDEAAWLRDALDKAFEGIDMAKLEKEWRAAD